MVGSCLVEKLLKLGANVAVLDNFSRGKTKLDGVSYIYGDAKLEGSCRDAFHGADFVFNLVATVAGVQYNQSHNAHMFESNVALQTMPLRIAAALGVKRFLQTSSVCVYAPEHNHPAQEEYGLVGLPTKANEGYSWAKRMGEYAAMWYAKESNLHTVIVRPSNIIGIRDYFDELAHVVPALIRKAIEDDTIVVNGTGKEQREFIYVEDVADGMLAALERGQKGRAYNLGTCGHTCESISYVVGIIQESLGISKPVEYKQIFDAGDDRRWSDCGRAESELGWSANWGLRRAIKAVCDWYVAERNNAIPV